MTFRRRRSLRVEFKAADCWVGVFWKRSDQPLLASQGPGTALDVWVCLLPMLPIHYSSRLSNAIDRRHNFVRSAEGKRFVSRGRAGLNEDGGS